MQIFTKPEVSTSRIRIEAVPRAMVEERRTVCWRDVLKLMYTPGLPEASDCAGTCSEQLHIPE